MRPLRSLSAWLLAWSVSGAIAETPPHARITPGMTITDVQALLGPPYTIRSHRELEVLFYCPPSWWGFPYGEPIYTAIALHHRRVAASRTWLAPPLGTCEQFVTAFQWSDLSPTPTAHRPYK